MSSPRKYLESLTSQVDQLIEAIKAPSGVFIIYGDGNNGKTKFLRLLESKKQFRRGNDINTISKGQTGIICSLPTEDFTCLKNVKTEAKIWIETNHPSEGIHFTGHFRDPKFEFTPEFIQAFFDEYQL